MDRVDGRYRGITGRNAVPIKRALQPKLEAMLGEKSSEMRIAAIQAAAKLGIDTLEASLVRLLRRDRDSEVRLAALKGLEQLQKKKIDEVLEIALSDRDESVRAAALSIVPESNLAEKDAVKLLQKIYRNGTSTEKEAALMALSEYLSLIHI